MTFEAEELYKYIRERMARFLVVNVIELLPHLPCLTQMDQERIRAQVKMEGNEAVVPLLLDSVRRRRNWERQLINALKNTEFEDLANDLETKLVSLAPRSHSASGGTSSPFPAHIPADSSLTHFTPPPKSEFSINLPHGPSHTTVGADSRLSSPDLVALAAYHQPKPTVNNQHSASATPAPSAVVPPSVLGTPMFNSPVHSVPESERVSPDTSVHSTPVLGMTSPCTPVQSTPVPVTTLPHTLVQSTPVLDMTSPYTPVRSTPVPSATLIHTPVHSTPVSATTLPNKPVQTRPGTFTPRPHVAQTAPAPHHLDLPEAVLNAAHEPSPAPSLISDSTEFKLPVQEMGNPLNSEESKDFKMPMQEKMGPSDLPKSCDSSQLQKNQTQHSNRDKSPQKHNTPSSDQATDQAIAIVPPPSMQVHPVRPSHESSGNWVPTTDKPGALCDAENMESANESTGNLPEGCYSITSSDLQFSESTSSATGNDGCDPVSKPEHDGVLDGFSDENSLKEQKIRALQGYQNDQLQEDFYDVNSPMNIQLNVDALKKLTDTRESSGLGQEETLKQNFKELHRKSKLNPISGTENAQSPALRSSHPVDDGVDSELEFKRNVQPYNSNVSISREELALRSGFSDVSFQKDSLVTNNETSASATNVNARTQDQSLKHDNKPEHVREVNFNPSHPVKCTKEGSDKESSQKVDLSKGDSFQLHNEVNHGECYFNSEENQTGLYNEDVKEFCGDIHQEPEYENEADKDREFKTGNLGDFSRCYSEDGLIDALSNKHMSFASQEKSQTNLPEKSIWDLRQADYVLVSTIFFAITIFAGLVWKRYHK